MSAVKKHTLPRPSCFARYNAMSAASSSARNFSGAPFSKCDADADADGPAFRRGRAARRITSSNAARGSRLPRAGGAFGWITANSSPPRRASVSLVRRQDRSLSATIRKRRVTGRMAEQVVDLLESIEVHIKNGDADAVAVAHGPGPAPAGRGTTGDLATPLAGRARTGRTHDRSPLQHSQRHDTQRQEISTPSPGPGSAGHGGGDKQRRTQRPRNLHFADTRRSLLTGRRAMNRATPVARPSQCRSRTARRREDTPPFGHPVGCRRIGVSGNVQAGQHRLRRTAGKCIPQRWVLRASSATSPA